jgi:hypothetical protein
MEPVGAFLDVCRLARKQTQRNLTVFALLGEKVFDPDYLPLETALEEGWWRSANSARGLGARAAAGEPSRAAGAHRRGRGTGGRQAEPGGQRHQACECYALDAIEAGADAKETKAPATPNPATGWAFSGFPADCRGA